MANFIVVGLFNNIGANVRTYIVFFKNSYSDLISTIVDRKRSSE